MALVGIFYVYNSILGDVLCGDTSQYCLCVFVLVITMSCVKMVEPIVSRLGT